MIVPGSSYWNVGIGFNWKVFTLDLRYHDSDLSKAECNLLTADEKSYRVRAT